jgi:ABC-type phosphate transport system substrate-binding protein
MKFLLNTILACSILWSYLAAAEISVIVHKDNMDSMDSDYIKRIFLGKLKGFPSSAQAIPLVLSVENSTHEVFINTFLNKSQTQYSAFWSRLVFTGKGTPPKPVDNERDMINLVSNNPNLIGFVDSQNVTSDVRVVIKF